MSIVQIMTDINGLATSITSLYKKIALQNESIEKVLICMNGIVIWMDKLESGTTGARKLNKGLGDIVNEHPSLKVCQDSIITCDIYSEDISLSYIANFSTCIKLKSLEIKYNAQMV